MKKKREKDTTNNKKLTRVILNIVVEKVIVHYEKGGIENIDPKVMAEKIEELHYDYRKLSKITRNIKHNKRIADFRKKMPTTMVFWPKDALKKMQSRSE